MPKIYDNIDLKFSQGLQAHIATANRVDYCVGYFNLRGWNTICDNVSELPGEIINENGQTVRRYARLLIGMTKTPKEEFLEEFADPEELNIDNKKANNLRKRLAREFETQLASVRPTQTDEITLKKLLKQCKEGRVVVKLYLAHQLHAKLYLAHSANDITPKIGLLGSSNFTMGGVYHQGELNIDVIEQDAATKLDKWFNDRWNDHWCIDITKDLIEVLEKSWSRPDSIPPYYIYLKMVYHLSRDARAGLAEYRISSEFTHQLYDFQQSAVKIASHHLHHHNGVMIGDVVGLGKTIMACAIAKNLEDLEGYNTLIICPKNIVNMWDSYRERYGMRAKILSQSKINELAELRIYKLVIIDESHNFRNSDGQRYRQLKQYISENGSKVILLSATPYNKTYRDLSNQLKLFLPDDYDLGITPEQYINSIGGPVAFSTKHPDTNIRTINAFAFSHFADDWRDVMKLYLVRRTRSFIKDNYAKTDTLNGRKYIIATDGQRSYFPERVPKRALFALDSSDETDQYARLYDSTTTDIIENLHLPRYGLKNYYNEAHSIPMIDGEQEIIDNLSRAGNRVIGFCRTMLFKRLESSGYSFLLSVTRHILRNYIFIYAIENGFPFAVSGPSIDVDMPDDADEDINIYQFQHSEDEFKRQAQVVYHEFETTYHSRYDWIRSELFNTELLLQHLNDDSKALLSILSRIGKWQPSEDRKVNTLYELLNKTHCNNKVIVFTQYSDTATYLYEQLKVRNITQIVKTIGGDEDIDKKVSRFSPRSSEYNIVDGIEYRVLITTDVLSEGQNLQDAYIVVNFDLPWALVRLVQRTGRVDRIGQKAEQILCYSFLPEDGIEHIIGLRAKLKARIRQNAEVVGSDEVFFEGDPINLTDLYSEKTGLFDDDEDTDVDLGSYAYQIWKNAIDEYPHLKKEIEDLPNLVFSAKENTAQQITEGVIVYAQTTSDTDSLAWLDTKRNVVTQSQFRILNAVKCDIDTPCIPKLENHHELVKKAVEIIKRDTQSISGTLGRKHSVKYRVYKRLERFYDKYKDTILLPKKLEYAMDAIFRYPLKETAVNILARHLKSSLSDETLCDLILTLYEGDNLCKINEETSETTHPQIICSLSLCGGTP